MVNGVCAVRDVRDGKHRELFHFVVVPGMVPEWPLPGGVAGFDVAFQDDFRLCRHSQRIGKATGDLRARAANQAGKGVFGNPVGDGRGRREQGRRIRADGDSNRETFPGMGFAPGLVVEGAATMGKPAHYQPVAPDQLLPIDPQVMPPAVRPLRDHQPPGNQRSRIFRPASEDRQRRQVDIISALHASLAGRICLLAQRRAE